MANNTLHFINRRFWWGGWILDALVACILAMVTMQKKWYDNPVVITYARRFSHISSIPFPAITICPMAKVRAEEFNLTETYLLLKNDSTLNEERYVIV